MLSESGQSGTQPIAQPCTDRIRFRCPISESVHGNRRSDRRPQSALILKRRNPAAPGPRPASRQTGNGPKAEPNPMSRPNPRTSPRVAATAALTHHPRQSNIAGIPRFSKPRRSQYTGNHDTPHGPNPISHPNPRISPIKSQPPEQTVTPRTGPEPVAAAYLDTPRRHAQKL